jgi:uncharacterized protein YvpB
MIQARSQLVKNKFYLKLVILTILLILTLAVGHHFCVSPAKIATIISSKINNVSSNLTQPVLKTSNKPIVASDSQMPVLPSSYLIKDFPWQSQAPTGLWDSLHNEACEEASVTLVDYYLTNRNLTANEMDLQIQAMVTWEEKTWKESDQQNLTVKETLKMAEGFDNLKGQVIKNATINDLKAQIAAGHPVIVPTAGQLLGNPNFRTPGPVYHMVVAIGYDKNSIVVQDVGTRNGNHYVYNQTIFFNAWHDWAGTEANIISGAKNMLVLSN